MLKEKQGNVVYKPLDFEFQVLELGGSCTQKYDAVQGDYLPDRTLTPFVLQPRLLVKDPHGQLNGDQTTKMVNVTWTVDSKTAGTAWQRGTHYQIDSDTHQLTIEENTDPGYMGELSFYGEFLDQRRGEVHKFRWKKTLACASYADNRLSLHIEQSKISLSPWKNRGLFTVPVQLFNGENPAADNDCIYKWWVWDEDNEVFDQVGLNSPELWYVAGKDSKQITLNQDYVQHLLLSCTARLKSGQSKVLTATVLVRRWYGQYDDDLVWLSGKYIFPDTPNAEAEVVVTRRTGVVNNPLSYFDIEILYNNGLGGWQHVCHGARGMVPRSMFPIDSTVKHRFGWILREKTALIPITSNGKYFTLGGKVLVGSFPTTAREE